MVKTLDDSLDDAVKDYPLWGQFNRFGPAKFVLRVLGSKLTEGNLSKLELSTLSAIVANGAPLVRAKLEKAEKRGGRCLEGKFVVGYPKQDPNSLRRFNIQYVGRLRVTSKRAEGLPSDLAFVRIEKEENGSETIGITEHGLHFACFPSPLIDQAVLQDEKVDEVFSDDEVKFLLDHVRTVRPGEAEFLEFVARTVNSENNVPKAIRGEVHDFLDQKHAAGIKVASKITAPVVATMTAGAVGKLTELGCIIAKRTGTRFTYRVGPRYALLVRS